MTMISNWDPWMTYLIVPGASIALGLVIWKLVFYILNASNRRKPSVFKAKLTSHLKQPAKFLLPVLFFYSSLSFLDLNSFWERLTLMLIIGLMSWLLIAFLNALEEIVKLKLSGEGAPLAEDRKVLTQLRFIKRLSIVIIFTLSAAAMLWTIPTAKQIGTTIMTSAGVIGIIVGVAAQKSIANLITGFQVAFSQPIKLADVVVIEGEWGTIEDITLTYAVVKIWDGRRLILPLSHFNENSIVNWTYKSQDLVGSVFFYVDYTFPVIQLREKLMEVIKDNPLWDKKSANLLVTNTTEDTMELRATVSAKNSSDVWELRCQVREELIGYIQKEHVGALPVRRKIILAEPETRG